MLMMNIMLLLFLIGGIFYEFGVPDTFVNNNIIFNVIIRSVWKILLVWMI